MAASLPHEHRWPADSRILLFAGLVLVLLVAGGCGGERRWSGSFHPSWSPDGEAIAYVFDPDPSAGCSYGSCWHRMELWVMGADGTSPRRLARGMGTDPALVWSPDGGSIAFTYFPRDAASGVFTIRKDGSHLRRLTTGGTPAAWLPDGTRLALLDEPRQLHVVNADGKARQRLTDLGPLEAAWSPDGARIALVTFDGLFVAGADGRGLRMLHPTPLSYIERIAWSPDGRRISFGLELDPLAGGFGVVDVDGGVVAFSSKDGYRWDSDYAMDASWSPDRRTIAIAKPEGGIDLVSADGVAWNRLSDTGEGPAWSPDGRRIAFSDSGDIYVVLSDGTGRRKLTEQLPTPPATERVSTDRDGSMRARKAPP